jgi:hypothetical protein
MWAILGRGRRCDNTFGPKNAGAARRDKTGLADKRQENGGKMRFQHKMNGFEQPAGESSPKSS